MIDISFEIDEISNKEHLHMSYAYALINGYVSLKVDHYSFWEMESILLVELAMSMEDWLQNIKYKDTNNYVDFIYNSIDYQEKNILVLKYIGRDYYNLSSSLVPGKAIINVNVNDVKSAFELYIKRLYNDIKSKTGVDFKK